MAPPTARCPLALACFMTDLESWTTDDLIRSTRQFLALHVLTGLEFDLETVMPLLLALHERGVQDVLDW